MARGLRGVHPADVGGALRARPPSPLRVPAMSTAPEPLTPAQVDDLLRPDPRTAAADLLVLRDALHRLSDAWTRIAQAAGELSRAAAALERRDAAGSPATDAERPRSTPPRAD